MSLQITRVNTPVGLYNVKCPYSMDPQGLTIHETGNVASAMAEISYMLGNNFEISYHFAIDDERAVQGLPLNRNGWHAGDGGNGFGNRKTIGLEHCFNWTGGKVTKGHPIYDVKYHKAIANGIELSAQLFLQYPKWGVPEAGKNIWRHYDHSRKNCPQRLIEEGKWLDYVAKVKARYLELKGIKKPVVSGAKVEKPKTDKQLADEVIKGIHGSGAERKAKLGSRYDAVQKLVDEMLKPKPVVKPKPVPKPVAKPTVVKSWKEHGFFYTDPRPDSLIYVRDQPSLKGKIIAEYYIYGVNESLPVEYHTVHINDGYVWLQYDRIRDGVVIGQGYIPCREYKNGKAQRLWGTIK